MSYHTYQTIAILFKVCIVGFTRKACYAMMKYWRSVRYAKFEVCIGGRPPSASFHRAHRSHNGGDIVMLRLAEIQIPNSVLCATTIYFFLSLSFFSFFSMTWVIRSKCHGCLILLKKTCLWRHCILLQWAQIQVHKTISLVWFRLNFFHIAWEAWEKI